MSTVDIHFGSLFSSIIADLSTKIGFNKAAMKSGLSGGTHAEEAVISWKYGCSSTYIYVYKLIILIYM